jgi:hypothetical protein
VTGALLAASIGSSVISKTLSVSEPAGDGLESYVVVRSAAGVERRPVHVVAASRARRLIRLPTFKRR